MAARIDWHAIFQSVLEDSENLRALSGKIIVGKAREYCQMIRVDFICHTQGDIAEGVLKPIVRPLAHFKQRILVEYKSTWQSLNEKTFRRYVARALDAETCDDVDYRNETTLTILTLHKPVSLLRIAKYRFERINAWKYRSRYDDALDIYVLIQREMRGVKAGEALALLQVIESERVKQRQVWQSLFDQDLENIDKLKQVMEKISGGAFMNVIKEAETKGEMRGRLEGKLEGKLEGRIEGKIEELLEVLSWTAPGIAQKYEAPVKAIKTEAELAAIKRKIKAELEEKTQ